MNSIPTSLCSTATVMFDFLVELSALSTPTSSSETDHIEKVESTQGRHPSPKLTEGAQQQTDERFNLQKQLQEKQKELEAAQEMVQHLRRREKNLTDR